MSAVYTALRGSVTEEQKVRGTVRALFPGCLVLRWAQTGVWGRSWEALDEPGRRIWPGAKWLAQPLWAVVGHTGHRITERRLSLQGFPCSCSGSLKGKISLAAGIS